MLDWWFHCRKYISSWFLYYYSYDRIGIYSIDYTGSRSRNNVEKKSRRWKLIVFYNVGFVNAIKHYFIVSSPSFTSSKVSSGITKNVMFECRCRRSWTNQMMIACRKYFSPVIFVVSLHSTYSFVAWFAFTFCFCFCSLFFCSSSVWVLSLTLSPCLAPANVRNNKKNRRLWIWTRLSAACVRE